MKQEENESISKWIARLHAVASELRAIDNRFTEDDERDIFFDGLKDSMKEKLHTHGTIEF